MEKTVCERVIGRLATDAELRARALAATPAEARDLLAAEGVQASDEEVEGLLVRVRAAFAEGDDLSEEALGQVAGGFAPIKHAGDAASQEAEEHYSMPRGC